MGWEGKRRGAGRRVERGGKERVGRVWRGEGGSGKQAAGVADGFHVGKGEKSGGNRSEARMLRWEGIQG